MRFAHRLASVGVLLGILACSDAAGRSVALTQDEGSRSSQTAARQVPLAEVAAVIRAVVATGADSLPGSRTRAEQTDLTALYEAGGYAPLWVDATGKPTPGVRDTLALLDDAAIEGLDPEDYASASLRRRATGLERASSLSPVDIASFDMAMSAGMLRYLRHLHLGRVDPRALGFRLVVPADPHDFAILLRSALTGQRIMEAAAELAPPLAQYRALRSMLARYRALAAGTAFEGLPPDTVRRGEQYAGLRALHRQLVALGDLPSETPAPTEEAVYDGPLVEGVKRFQVRHGLDDDGVIGRDTHAALAVPLTWRVRQIELALERLRWLPDLGNRRFLALNIPMYQLWAWDSILPAGDPSLGMRAIVGRALSTQTPVFVEDMRYLVFRPYWNVPRSILRNEILPILERDPDYLRRHDMEIVRGPGDDAQRVAATPENVALLRQGLLRLRQLPGPRNALGLVKFVFPNDADVYMHGTPAQELFSRTRRDFSHGCVRLEDPVALAEWVLEDQPEWSRNQILAAMSGTESRRVNLTHPVQVVLFYITAIVMPEDGTIRFVEDIYRHDRRLDRALADRRAGE